MTGSSRKRISRKNLEKIKIPLPSIEVQKRIVNKIEKEEQKINDLEKEIENSRQKIKDKIGEVWGEN